MCIRLAGNGAGPPPQEHGEADYIAEEPLTAYYNELDPYPAAWLVRLADAGHITAGRVDARSIAEVQPADLDGSAQAHFFAGIGAWSYALRLAGWDDARPVWTGSCPCQPFSNYS
jgi:DNA (cytosine-5)-methyltransferase 1